MDHEKLAKSHGILLSVMEFYQFCPQNVPNLYVFCHHLFSAKCSKCKIAKRDGHGKLTIGHGKVMGKNVVKFVGTLVIMHM